MRYIPRVNPSIISMLAATVVAGAVTFAPGDLFEQVEADREKPLCKYIDTIHYDVGDFALYDCQSQQGNYEELRQISSSVDLEERVKKITK